MFEILFLLVQKNISSYEDLARSIFGSQNRSLEACQAKRKDTNQISFDINFLHAVENKNF
jgi:hypothetical protein